MRTGQRIAALIALLTTSLAVSCTPTSTSAEHPASPSANPSPEPIPLPHCASFLSTVPKSVYKTSKVSGYYPTPYVNDGNSWEIDCAISGTTPDGRTDQQIEFRVDRLYLPYKGMSRNEWVVHTVTNLQVSSQCSYYKAPPKGFNYAFHCYESLFQGGMASLGGQTVDKNTIIMISIDGGSNRHMTDGKFNALLHRELLDMAEAIYDRVQRGPQ